MDTNSGTRRGWWPGSPASARACHAAARRLSRGRHLGFTIIVHLMILNEEWLTGGALYPGESRNRRSRRRELARPRVQGAGLPHRPQQLQRLRQGLEGIVQGPAGANHRRYDRAARQGHAGRNRPDRLRRWRRTPARSPSKSGHRSRSPTIPKRSRLAAWSSPPASLRATSNPACRCKRGGIRAFPTTARTSSCRPASCSTISRGGGKLARPGGQGAGPDLNNFNGFDEVWKENFKVRRRARPSAPPGSWSRTRWSRST